MPKTKPSAQELAAISRVNDPSAAYMHRSHGEAGFEGRFARRCCAFLTAVNNRSFSVVVSSSENDEGKGTFMLDPLAQLGVIDKLADVTNQAGKG